jgi:Luciferase-like monooxygenase
MGSAAGAGEPLWVMTTRVSAMIVRLVGHRRGSQTTSLPIATAVTCPTTRIHPAVVAQAAATSAVLTGGQFTLGVGSGEALNEHVLGDRW